MGGPQDSQLQFLHARVDRHISHVTEIELWDAVHRVGWYGNTAGIIRLWSEGYTFEEIADVLDIPASTAYDRFTKGMADLRKQFGLCGPKAGIPENLAASAPEKVGLPASSIIET